ncbi:KAP family P-loop NTPase fold protein [Phaeobacter italicus]|uniref:KAP family P-loop NTPase fold protein n=1 Tax=Phaeobacter italicus TaxID=481446 RepID=UPI00248E267E|nr:P-loop NTPase fold protein [Phaeobacter italicus]
MRLTVPEPKIDLYNDGFADHDQLDRKTTGDKLSDLVERIDDPMVIALDGAWGSGKSFFLKCWVGEHLKRKENTTQTVYFDAFEHDFLDDPLIALTGAIAERFESAESREEDQKSERSKKIKKAAWAVGKGALRIGASVATVGATEALSDMGDAVANAVGDEARTFLSSDIGNGEAEKFWTAHEARIAAMKAFRIALTELTKPVTEDQASEDDRLRVGNPTRKLVVVIDELDRCRPDYALSLLEIIKHFFNVPGVHFVLGVNLTELQNSVRARYGSGVDADRYLRKFYQAAIALPNSWSTQSSSTIVSDYFEFCSDQLSLREKRVWGDLKLHVTAANAAGKLSLRDLEHIAAIAAITPELPARVPETYGALLGGLIVLKAIKPVWIDRVRNRNLRFDEFVTIFAFKKVWFDKHHHEDLSGFWKAALGESLDEGSLQGTVFQERGRVAPDFDELIPKIVDNYLNAFQLS